MGNRCSRTYDSDNPVNDLDAKLGQAIADARALAGKTEAKRHTMDELMLKFPTLRNGFRKCRELFAAFDQNNDDLVSFSEFQAGCLEIGLDSESVRHLFQAADIDHSHKIDPSEFFLVLTIVHIGLPEQGKKIHPDIGKALSIMEHFFAYFDDSADGFIEKDELLKAFGVDRKGSEVRFNSSAAESLFAKLDFDHSGKVSFKEFLVGIEAMVMEDYEMEKEEQRQSDELKRSATDIARQAGVAAVLAADEEAAVAVGPQTLA